MIQVHYARGCTLAEAFYQSVHGPYQLLIVGDPLCRPWAKIPQVSVPGVEPGSRGAGQADAQARRHAARRGARRSLRVVRRRRARPRCKPGDSLDLSTAKLADGYHELRVVAIGPGPIESQGRASSDHHGQPRPQDRGVAGHEGAAAGRQAARDRRPSRPARSASWSCRAAASWAGWPARKARSKSPPTRSAPGPSNSASSAWARAAPPPTSLRNPSA